MSGFCGFVRLVKTEGPKIPEGLQMLLRGTVLYMLEQWESDGQKNDGSFCRIVHNGVVITIKTKHQEHTYDGMTGVVFSIHVKIKRFLSKFVAVASLQSESSDGADSANAMDAPPGSLN